MQTRPGSLCPISKLLELTAMGSNARCLGKLTCARMRKPMNSLLSIDDRKICCQQSE